MMFRPNSDQTKEYVSDQILKTGSGSDLISKPDPHPKSRAPSIHIIITILVFICNSTSIFEVCRISSFISVEPIEICKSMVEPQMTLC